MNKFQMGIVGRRVCIKCEFYRNVDSKIIDIQLTEGRERKLFYRGGVRQRRKRFIVRGAGSEKFSEEGGIGQGEKIFE